MTSAFTILMLVLLGFVTQPSLSPQSPEAWQYAVGQGKALITTVYQPTPQGLVCQKSTQLEVIQALETTAEERHEHPSLIAEELVVYLWDDWTLLYVPGYDLREVLTSSNKKRLEEFLEQFYQLHRVCLLGILKVLVYGYEKHYQLTDGQYLRSLESSGERYQLLALEPKYFPGTGILEPLGLVAAVRLADFFTFDWLREKAIGVIAETLQRRAQTSSDPLKVRRK